MPERTDGNGIHAGGGNVLDGVEGDTAAGFEPEFAIREFHGFALLSGAHVVEQEHVHAVQSEEIGHLLQGGGFELDTYTWAFGAQFVNRGLEGLQITIGRKVVVFNHGVVVEAHAVVRAATIFDGGFFEQTPARGRFSGVPDLNGMRFHGIDVAFCLRGHAA